MEKEVGRIKKEHQDDACAVINDCVKGSLKVTRAFGAGFLKQKCAKNKSLEMGTPYLLHEFKRQASFFCKEKIKAARLALTDVTPAQLLTEEATQWAPDTKTLGLISRAAFEVDDYWRIVEILHRSLSKYDKNNWRGSYNAIIILEHLLTHGPESASEEFQMDKHIIKEMESFQHIDQKGFNWGLAVRKKSETVSKLLENGPLLKEERDRARKLSRGIKGFGATSSSSSKTTTTTTTTLGRRSCSDRFSIDQQNSITKTGFEKSRMEKLVVMMAPMADVEDHPFNDSDNQTLL